MAIFKITRGNTFTLHIQLQKNNISENRQVLEELDATKISNLKVLLSFASSGSPAVRAPILQLGKTNGIQVRFPGDLKEGIYDIVIHGVYDNNNLCCVEHNVFSIVGRNGKSNIPVGIVDGEQGRIYNAKFWLELHTANESYCSYYGALDTQNVAEVNLAKMRLFSGLLNGRVINIETTDTNDVTWIVSPVPLKFSQSHLPLHMSETVFNGLYYYESDKLKPGDNILNII